MGRRIITALAVGAIAAGGLPLAASAIGPGQDSSGQHHWTTECAGVDFDGFINIRFTNTGADSLKWDYPLSGTEVVPGGSVSGGRGDPGEQWKVLLLDDTIVDSGFFDDCADSGPAPAPPSDGTSYSAQCVGADFVVSNTGIRRIQMSFQLAFGSPVYTLDAGESVHLGQPGIDTAPPGTPFAIAFEEPEGSNIFYGFEHGVFLRLHRTTPPATQPPGEVPDEAPLLISECRGADWYLINPDVDGETYTWAYRIGAPINGVLYDPDYVSNNPNNAIYGEVLVPAGTNEVGYVDDFNATHTATRPAACGGPETPTTEPTTTVVTTPTEPTVPGEPAPDTPGLNPVTGEGFVAPGSQIGPGTATFGAAGFGAGEEVEVTLFSTPRSLGTVTADDAGAVSISFEVLASDGAGEHHVVFSGPSGSVSIPFTLVLPEGAAPPTTVAVSYQ